jgi:hypothetical protein
VKDRAISVGESRDQRGHQRSSWRGRGKYSKSDSKRFLLQTLSISRTILKALIAHAHVDEWPAKRPRCITRGSQAANDPAPLPCHQSIPCTTAGFPFVVQAPVDSAGGYHSVSKARASNAPQNGRPRWRLHATSDWCVSAGKNRAVLPSETDDIGSLLSRR